MLKIKNNVGGSGKEIVEDIIITSSLPSNLNQYIQICGIDKNGSKILVNGYSAPLSVKKNCPLMIRVAEYPYASVSGQYTNIGVFSASQGKIIERNNIPSGEGSLVALIIPTGNLDIYDTD